LNMDEIGLAIRFVKANKLMVSRLCCLWST
jgi:hypothetical protein